MQSPVESKVRIGLLGGSGYTQSTCRLDIENKLLGYFKEVSMMKRLLVLSSFVGGLICASAMQDSQALGQESDEARQSATQEKNKTESDTSTSNTLLEPNASTPPARLSKNEALEKQQAIQDIMEMRQRFGSVLSGSVLSSSADGGSLEGDQTQEFSQLIQHLVEEEESQPKASNQAATFPVTQNRGLKNHPVLNHPVQNQIPALDGFTPNKSQNSTSVQTWQSGRWQTGHWQSLDEPSSHDEAHRRPENPIQSSSYTATRTTPRYPNRGSSNDPAQVQRLRKVARQLDESASDLEELGAYEVADQIREKAQLLRESCRN